MNAMISDPNDDDIAALGDAARHTFMMAAIGQAQAHATLALAAATALGIRTVGITDDEAVAWYEAVSDAR
jgi:flavin-dependent dehydrogenase